MATRKTPRVSDRPADLAHEREKVVHNFLKRGVELTEQLIHENEQLQNELLELEAENAKLRAQVASDDAIRELLTTIEALEGERKTLLSRSRELERASQHYQGRFHEMEQEINDLASLHVASFQLGKTLAPDRVVRHLCELMEQLVGARSFVLYLVDSGTELGMPIASRGMDSDLLQPVPLDEGPVGDACLTGLIRMRELPTTGSLDDPLAVIPLLAEGAAIGVIVVLALLPQKARWAPVDRELFKLLEANGATAMIAANLHAASSGGPQEAVRGLAEKLQQDHEGPASARTSDTGR